VAAEISKPGQAPILTQPAARPPQADVSHVLPVERFLSWWAEFSLQTKLLGGGHPCWVSLRMTGITFFAPSNSIQRDSP